MSDVMDNQLTILKRDARGRVHSERFIAILQKHYPTWREARAELNELPLSAEEWRE